MCELERLAHKAEAQPSQCHLRNRYRSGSVYAEEAAIFRILSAAARLHNFLGYAAQYIEEVAGRLKGAAVAEAILLGLGLPFGHHTIETWMCSRYRRGSPPLCACSSATAQRNGRPRKYYALRTTYTVIFMTMTALRR